MRWPLRRCPTVNLVLLTVLSGLIVFCFPALRAVDWIMGILIVQAALSVVITRVVRRRRAASGACMTCDHDCRFRLDGSAPDVPDESVLMPTPKVRQRPAWTDSDAWQQLQAYDRR